MTQIRPPVPRSSLARAERAHAESFRQAFLLAVLVAVLAVASPLRAQAPRAEHTQAGAPQAVGALHSVRTIPEACTRLEGLFTGQDAQPYRMQAVQTAPACQPRARFVEAAQAAPSPASGWILNTETRIPQAGCAGREAVVKVWRKPVAQDLARDGQGQVRIYLQDAQKQAAAGQVRALPEYTAQLDVAGRCG
ncbi:hypothetical protein [Pseudoxanthomonas sp. 10H]|uniref:hypothetical protein n=1 Tax=Pseudoxanthomonas sp. 10H TaxID=3242729 RepID=UPI0035561753